MGRDAPNPGALAGDRRGQLEEYAEVELQTFGFRTETGAKIKRPIDDGA